MDIWAVVDVGNFPHVSSHLTEKGALIYAYRCLLTEYEEMMIDVDGDCEDFRDEYPETHAFVKSICSLVDIEGNPKATKEDMNKHFSNFKSFIGKWTDGGIEFQIHKTRVQA